MGTNNPRLGYTFPAGVRVGRAASLAPAELSALCLAIIEIAVKHHLRAFCH
jgi:hypothetical protein